MGKFILQRWGINHFNKIYELDEKNQTVKDVTNEMISGYPELSSGLAEARILDSDEGGWFYADVK